MNTLHGAALPHALSFQLLGPVAARTADGRPVALGSPQQRAVLAVLLLREGRPVTTEEVVDGVWGEAAPRCAYGAVRTYVSKLRTALAPEGPAGPDRERSVASVPGGYALRLTGHAVDALLFEREAADRTGDARTVHDRLARALERWQGVPLAGVPGPYAERQRTRFAEVRRGAREALHGCALDLGRHADAVAALSALVAEEPFRERPYELLMLALHRSGRRAEALEAYGRARQLLRTELGIEPGRQLALLHRRVLTADPELAAWTSGVPTVVTDPTSPTSPTARRPTPAPGRPALRPAPGRPAPRLTPRPAPESTPQLTPQQLPSDTADFTGRAAVVDELRTLLARAAHGRDGRAVTVVTVTGTAGVGKTTVAVHVAHALGDEFPDGRFHVDLGAGSTPADPSAVLLGFLTALGTPSDRIPLDPEQRAAFFRTVLAGRRMLLVLDNAFDAEQIRPLLPGTSGCAVLITTRSRSLAVPGAHRLDIDVQPEDEALTLLAAIAGAERVAAEPAAARSLVAACGRLPLAVRIVGSRLAARPGHGLAALDARLRDERALLDELHVGDLAVETAFHLGYRNLAPEPARAFRLLSLLDAPSLPLPVAAALLGEDERTAERLAETLVDAGVLEPYGPERYRFHDLLRLYARRLAERTDDEGERGAALLRVLDLLCASVVRAARAALDPPPPAVWIEPVVHPGMPFADIDEVRAWFRAEHGLLAGTADQLLRSGQRSLRRTVDLLAITAVCGIFEGQAHYQELGRITGVAAERAAASGDLLYRAKALHIRGWLAFVTQRYEDAEAELRAALACAEELDSDQRRHVSGTLLALVLWGLGRAEEAEGAMRWAQAYAGDPDDPDSPASVVRYTARLHTALGPDRRDRTGVSHVLREVDATGASLTTPEGVRRLGAALRAADAGEGPAASDPA
ncbi:BTAD domain-containing putative transcriptional regulator [Streptomyces sp. NPDC047315]|uniref:AfsR/SARP family transcriptional regulator n=1 Tax=Streptomyces sp. NPDC047315 TaxID=3155142 RepID=UPI003400CE28